MAHSALADLSDFVQRRLRRVATSGGAAGDSMELLNTSFHAAMHSEQSRAIFDRTRNGSLEQDDSSGEVGWESQRNSSRPQVGIANKGDGQAVASSSSHARTDKATTASTAKQGGAGHNNKLSRGMLPPIQNTTKSRFAAMLYCAVFDGDLVVARRMIAFLHTVTEERLGLYLDREETVPFMSSPFTIIHYAVASQSAEMLQLVLFFLSDVQKITGFVDVNVSSAVPHSCTPLHLAVALGHFDMVRTLLASNARARACRGPRSTRVSALQDALYGLATTFASELDALVHAPAEPLYTQGGVTVPPRHANRMAPWLLWVKHGPEERAKIPRGAWRVDTNSFIRSRTPSPEQQQQRRSSRHPHSELRVPAASRLGVGGEDSSALARTTERLTPSRLSDDSEHSGGGLLSNTSGTGSQQPQQRHHSRDQPQHRSTSPPQSVAEWKSWRHQLHESNLFRIAVLLLDQGAELIFQKAGLRHAEVRRLQQVTSLVQKEFNRKLQLHEDAGLAQIMKEDSALQAAMQQHEEGGGDAGDEGVHHDDGNSYSPPGDDDRQEESLASPQRNGESDDTNQTLTPALSTHGRDRSSKKTNYPHKRAAMASLVASVTPSHPLFLKAVIAHRVREAHAQRLHVLQERLPKLLAPLGRSKPVRVGDAVWVKEGSRYCPKPRHPLALLKAGVPTPMLLEAANELVHNRYLAERVYDATLHLLTKPLTNLEDGDGSDDDVRVVNHVFGHQQQQQRNPYRSITTATTVTSCNSDYPTAEVTTARGDEISLSVINGLATAVDTAHRGQQSSSSRGLATPSAGIPKILIGGCAEDNATNSQQLRLHHNGDDDDDADAHPQSTRSAQHHILPQLHHPPGDGGFAWDGDENDASLVRFPETSTNPSSHRSAVFSQSLMVGRPEVVVGCVACIVSIPDVAVQALEEALDMATSCGANPPPVPSNGPRNEEAERGEERRARLAPPRHRLFAGLVVEPRYGSSSSGSLLPDVLQRGGRGRGNSSDYGVGDMAGGAGISILSDVVHPNTSNAGPPLLAKDVECTLPYCSLFVPLSDITVVRQHTAADVAVHRLRKEVNRLAAGLKIAKFQQEEVDDLGGGGTRAHLQQQQLREHLSHSRQPGDAHKMMFRCLQKQRELRLLAEQAVRSGV